MSDPRKTAGELIRRGYEDARDYLDATERGAAPVPLVMHDHRGRPPVAA